MIDKVSCNPARSRFVEALIDDIQDVESYEKFGITRENVGVITTYVIQRFFQIKEAEGISAIDEILTYKFNEQKFPKI
jgi:hypothetical protein